LRVTQPAFASWESVHAPVCGPILSGLQYKALLML